MFEDARKTSGHENDLVVEDLAELVAEAIELDALSLKDLPPLAERITEAVATRIADVVAARLDAIISARLAPLPQPELPEAPRATLQAPGDGHHSAMSEAPALSASLDGSPAHGAAANHAAAPTSTPLAELREMNWDRLRPLTPAQLPTYESPAKETLRILVAVKHVAVLSDEYEFTADGCDIRPDFLEHGLNEWDDAALDEALQLIETSGTGEVVAVCIGPEEAEVSLRKALAKGANRAVRVWHDGLTAADPLTIARGIAGVSVQEQPDLILTGVQSSDHGNGATGTALARILGLPHAAVVVALQWLGHGQIEVTRELEGGIRHRFALPTPSLLTIQTGGTPPRYATMRMIKEAKKKPIVTIDGADLFEESGGYQVRRMYTPVQQKAKILEGGLDEVATFVAQVIREQKGA